jgi:Fur family zinc uptake transcriptional regulator
VCSSDLICEGCGTSAEAAGDGLRAQLEATASGLGCRVWRSNMEAVGLCPACAVAA